MKWARILVSNDGSSIPREVVISRNGVMYHFPIWAECQPHFEILPEKSVGGDEALYPDNAFVQWAREESLCGEVIFNNLQVEKQSLTEAHSAFSFAEDITTQLSLPVSSPVAEQRKSFAKMVMTTTEVENRGASPTSNKEEDPQELRNCNSSGAESENCGITFQNDNIEIVNWQCHITGVYAPNCYKERRIVWDELSSVRGLMEGPWAICGDFNVTRYIFEKKNGTNRTRGMGEFSDFIEDMKLVDLQLEDAKYTWFKGDQHEIAAKIDRVKNWWSSFNFSGRPDYVLACKLKTLKSKLKEWRNGETENLGIQRKKLLKQMADLDTKRENRVLTDEETTKKSELLLKYEELLKKEEISWNKSQEFSEEDRVALQSNFDETEVLRCLKLCASDKAPGPDGFTMGFFIKCWEVVKQDILDTFQNFHDQKVFEKSFNATFIVLIPKKKVLIANKAVDSRVKQKKPGFFQSQRGLRQGDLLSPFLFLIAMEGLNNMIKTTKLRGASGLHINRRKSLMYPINQVNNMSWLATILGGEIGTLPTTYLRLPLGAKSKSIDIWNSVIEKSVKKLARAIRKRKDFLVKWKSLITGKKNGGLGIKNLNLQSKALRMKWLWKYANGNLEELFPDIYSLVTFQQGYIADLWTPQGWNFNFRRQLNDWEVQRLAEFVNTMVPFNELQTGEYIFWWTGNNRGVYKVNRAYKLMDQANQQNINWPWKPIWKSRIPHKVSCFVWLLAKEAVLTQDNVMKRGITLCSRCFLCEETLETVNNLFLHCKYTQQLWRIFFSLKGIYWALKSWEDSGAQAKDRDRWRLIPAAIWWAIWKERNFRCFESIENSVQNVKLNCILLLCFWCNQLYSNDTVSIIDVLDSI
ncbi:putative mannosyl-oligosaccharide 1,2-alpha-mannosidase MNS3-like [Capsicum annuum]|nr:putative mannosyl-oligosaccharide 1,2-alpha-mannosidase MNS3-like [Capsicum annuum]